MNEAPFEEDKEEEPLEPLRWEHFVFPLGLLGGGMVLSTLTFLVEIIVSWKQIIAKWKQRKD